MVFTWFVFHTTCILCCSSLCTKSFIETLNAHYRSTPALYRWCRAATQQLCLNYASCTLNSLLLLCLKAARVAVPAAHSPLCSAIFTMHATSYVHIVTSTLRRGTFVTLFDTCISDRRYSSSLPIAETQSLIVIAVSSVPIAVLVASRLSCRHPPAVAHHFLHQVPQASSAIANEGILHARKTLS